TEGCPLRPVKDHFTVLTVPRAHSRIHRITKFTLKRVAEQSRSRTDATKYYTWVLWRGCHLSVWST
ncbi:hypothetical protein DNX55_25010, partial [Escherichia coli]|nr:hypothetical protein [Escherichia coli]